MFGRRTKHIARMAADLRAEDEALGMMPINKEEDNMGLFSESDQDKRARERKEAREAAVAAEMQEHQLIMAMILELDAGFNQALADHPLGNEAIKRCGYDPYK